MRVPVESYAPFTFGRPEVLFDGVYNLRSDTGISYHPHPDGARLLLTRSAEVASGGSIRVVTRWFDTLEAIK